MACLFLFHCLICCLILVSSFFRDNDGSEILVTKIEAEFLNTALVFVVPKMTVSAFEKVILLIYLAMSVEAWLLNKIAD